MDFTEFWLILEENLFAIIAAIGSILTLIFNPRKGKETNDSKEKRLEKAKAKREAKRKKAVAALEKQDEKIRKLEEEKNA